MKKILLLATALIFSGCSKINNQNPSQNSALSKIAGKTQENDSGFLQKSLDGWIEKEWTPAVEKNDKIKDINTNENRSFTIQEYINKIRIYNRDKNQTLEDSNIKKIDSMPVIGKSR
ncbi:hypothetical protein [Sulfurimonas sp.]|uniref:hypothetical protein n=1 Tax=Sulfurimonas sp. TaxID=2022749 RepID=UPI00261ABEB5|nr:hypothetical protein [Sulfurimonas sp.]MDD5157307.1 hypothetical protein [Sulfurimonas sp.]